MITLNRVHSFNPSCNKTIQILQLLRRLSETKKIFHDHNGSLEKTPITSQLWQMRSNSNQNSSVNVESSSEPSLVSKSTKESKLTIRYHFESDNMLKDLYSDHTKNILTGKLFEDLDAFAGNIAIKHCENDPNTRKYSLVTVSVDKIIQNQVIPVTNDIVLTGQVAWVGRSSLDVIMEIHSMNGVSSKAKRKNIVSGSQHAELSGLTDIDIDTVDLISSEYSTSRLLSSVFTYAARDRVTSKSSVINKLICETPHQQELFQERQIIATSRRQSSSTLPSQDINVLQQLTEAGSAVEDMPALAHPHAVLMKLTSLENSFICQPQNVNTAGRVFGGFLIHRAYDLALATCYTFSGVYPIFQQVDEISFRKPVDVGNLIRMKSRVIYTSDTPIKPLVMIEVTCQVVKPERASSFVSNSFYFIFGFDKSVTVKKVLPLTSEEASQMSQ
eukprot:gene6474-8904_t